jgi:hypothetical protein
VAVSEQNTAVVADANAVDTAAAAAAVAAAVSDAAYLKKKTEYRSVCSVYLTAISRAILSQRLTARRRCSFFSLLNYAGGLHPGNFFLKVHTR